jgi:hypothetical protein
MVIRGKGKEVTLEKHDEIVLAVRDLPSDGYGTQKLITILTKACYCTSPHPLAIVQALPFNLHKRLALCANKTRRSNAISEYAFVSIF